MEVEASAIAMKEDSKMCGRGRSNNNSRGIFSQRYEKSNVQCHYYKKIGHYASKFRKKKYDMYQQNENLIKREETESEKKENVFIICNVEEESNKDAWYLDNGCSNHMSGNKEMFSSIDEYVKSEVRMGNNIKLLVMGK
jgi:hypothetical protein